MNELGDPRDDFGLADVFGVRYLGEVMGPLPWDYMRIKGGHPVIDGVPDDPLGADLLVAAPEFCLKVTSVEGAPLALQLEPWPARYWRTTPESDYPTIVARECGEGRVIYFPGTFAGRYWDNGFLDYLRILKNAFAWTTPRGYPVEMEGPEALEITIYQGASWLVVHLTNYQYSLRRPFRTVIPMHDIRISLRMDSKPSHLTLMSDGTDLPFIFEDRHVRFTVREIGLYEGIIVWLDAEE
jgi:hypothetical protein